MPNALYLEEAQLQSGLLSEACLIEFGVKQHVEPLVDDDFAPAEDDRKCIAFWDSHEIVLWSPALSMRV